jgi:hypothetical protein
MNLVALLIVAAIVNMSYGAGENDTMRMVIALAATAGIVGAVVVSKRRGTAGQDDEGSPVSSSGAGPLATPVTPGGRAVGHQTGATHDPTQVLAQPASGSHASDDHRS